MAKPQIAIIGAGASGLMAAHAAVSRGAGVCVYEKNEKPGKKIYITGKGRCNLTNSAGREEFLSNVISNPKFMYKSFSVFNNTDLCNLIEKNGTPLKEERGGRIFPVSDHASDITKALLNACKKVNFRFNTKVKSLLYKTGEDGCYTVTGLITEDGKKEDYDAVILAAGGPTYPGAGGCYFGYDLVKPFDVKVVSIIPSLVPFNVKEEYIKNLQGLSLKNVSLIIRGGDDKIIFKEFGELLFTHFGVSGPLVLTASSKIGRILDKEGILKAYIDLKSAIPDAELDKRLIKMIEDNSKKQCKSFFEGLLPRSMQDVFLELSGLDYESKVSCIDKKMRKKIFGLLRGFPFTITGTRSFKEAIITKGGIDVKEVNPKTMELKKVKGLYVCGEVLDIDALTGGYNLQCAFSTGFVAGHSAANSMEEV